MRKILLSICLVLPFLLQAQAPVWLDLQSRNRNYPTEKYYTGIGYSNLISNRQSAITNAENAARIEMLSTILTSVRSIATSRTDRMKTLSICGASEQVIKRYAELTQLEIAFRDIPGIKLEHHVQGSEVTAFAYVDKQGLLRYYDRRITTAITKIETALDNADMLAERGEKIKARNTAESVVPQLADIENAQRILLAIDSRADIQDVKTSELVKRLVSTLASLSHATAIYIQCTAKQNGRDYPMFESNIKSIVSKAGCNFVNNSKDADWVVSIDADIVWNNTTDGGLSCVRTNGSVSVTNNITGQNVFSGTIADMEEGHPQGGVKGCGGRESEAISKSYQESARIVGNKVVELLRK